jgi:hypothetical protein
MNAMALQYRGEPAFRSSVALPDQQDDYEKRLHLLKAKAGLLGMIDHMIIEGTELQFGFFVFLLNSARNELVNECDRLVIQAD